MDGAYQPIEIEWQDEGRCRGYSEFLGLYVCWEDGELRWYNPKTQSYLRTHADEVDSADSAEAELRRLRQRLRELGEPD